jgi:hypothetical protein
MILSFRAKVDAAILARKITFGVEEPVLWSDDEARVK